MRPRFVPNLPLTVTVLIWGLNFIALKLLYNEIEPPALALVRYVVMTVFLALLCLARRETLRYPPGEAGKILFGGFIGMGAYMVLFLEGMRGTTAAEGAIMLSTAPIFTILLSARLGQEHASAGAFVGSVIAFAGVGMVVLTGHSGGHGSLLGNGLVLISAAVWAFYVVLTRPILARHSPLRTLTLSMPGALVALLPWGLGPALDADLRSFSLQGWLLFAHVSLLAGSLAFVLFYEGVRKVGAGGATLYQFLVPPCAALFAWLLTGRALVPLQWVGMAVAVAGVAWASWSRRLPPAATPADVHGRGNVGGPKGKLIIPTYPTLSTPRPKPSRTTRSDHRDARGTDRGRLVLRI